MDANDYKAHRIISQIVFTGSKALGRAFVEAFRQAAASSQRSRVAAGADTNGSGISRSLGISLDEACKILNVKPPYRGRTDMDYVIERFKTMYDRNDPTQGGSFYLQSKILRARERIELEVSEAAEKSELERVRREGWKPKLYKD